MRSILLTAFDSAASGSSLSSQGGQPYMHPSNGLFMPNDPGLHRLHKRTLPIPRPPHQENKTNKKNISPKATHRPQPRHPRNPTLHVAQRVSRFTRDKIGASEHSSRERHNLAQGLGEGPPGPPSWLAEKGVCGSVARILGHGLHPALRNSGI